MTTRTLKAIIYAVFTVIPLVVFLIFWPQWVHIPWWQTLVMLGAIQGTALNSAYLTRTLLTAN